MGEGVATQEDMMKRTFMGRLALLAGMIAVVGAANAFALDGSILIDKSANNKKLTVKYDGAAAEIVEMVINGKSVATRKVDGGSLKGELVFDVNTAALNEGSNTIEIRLLGTGGKVLGTEKTTVKIDRSGTGTVFLTVPENEAEVRGVVEIKVGFRSEMNKPYVSFFINDTFQVLKNYAPYNYRWDTTAVKNGWHEVQAWVVDEKSATFKTEKVRVFVNNPGGRTDRQDDDTTTGPVTDSTTPPVAKPATSNPPTAPDSSKPVSGADAKPKPMGGTIAGSTSGTVQPKGTAANHGGSAAQPGSVMHIEVIKKPENAKPTNGDLVAVKPPTTITTKPKLAPVTIGYGTRLADTDHLSVSYEGRDVNFDVSPSIENGVPLTPFRHLFESAGGEVKWNNALKLVEGLGDGLTVTFRIGDANATVNGSTFLMEVAPYLKQGRSIVPMSFMSDALKVDVQYDAATGHVLITSKK